MASHLRYLVFFLDPIKQLNLAAAPTKFVFISINQYCANLNKERRKGQRNIDCNISLKYEPITGGTQNPWNVNGRDFVTMAETKFCDQFYRKRT